MKKPNSDILASDGERALATSLSNLSTASQLEMILNLSNALDLEFDEIAEKLFNCKTEMLSISGAKDVIGHLNNLLPEGNECNIFNQGLKE